MDYRQTSNIERNLVGNRIVENSNVVGASPVGAAPTTSSFSTQQMASVDRAKTKFCKTRRETFKCWELVRLIVEVWRKVDLPRSEIWLRLHTNSTLLLTSRYQLNPETLIWLLKHTDSWVWKFCWSAIHTQTMCIETFCSHTHKYLLTKSNTD